MNDKERETLYDVLVRDRERLEKEKERLYGMLESERAERARLYRLLAQRERGWLWDVLEPCVGLVREHPSLVLGGALLAVLLRR